jgi:hypothetical protein
METWPTTLPLPNLSGYSAKKAGAFVRTEMEKGPARQRKKSRGTPTQIKVAWRLTRAEKAIFLDFYENDIQDGAAWFLMNLDIGAGMQLMKTRFIDDPDRNAMAGMHWNVSVTLEVIRE